MNYQKMLSRDDKRLINKHIHALSLEVSAKMRDDLMKAVATGQVEIGEIDQWQPDFLRMSEDQ